MMAKPSTIELDPDQSTAWYAILNKADAAISGLKEQQQFNLVQHLVLNALLNGEKCLIISDSTAFRQNLKNGLSSHKLDNYLDGTISSPFSNTSIPDLLNENIGKKKWNKPAEPTQFTQILSKLEYHQQRLERVYDAVRKPVFANLSWPQLCAVFWDLETQTTQESPSSPLPQTGLNYTLEEFLTLHEIIQQASYLYQSLPKFDHELKQLHSQVFQKKEEANALRFVEDKLRAYAQRLGTLSRKYQQCIEEYGNLLRQNFEQQTQFFLNQTHYLLAQISEKAKIYGPRFLDAKLGKLKWYGVLSNQGRSAIIAYKQLLSEFESLRSKFERVPWFTFSWPSLHQTKSIRPVKSCLESFENSLNNGLNELEKFIQEEQLRLNAKSALPELEQNAVIRDLEEEMDALLEEINSIELLNQRLDHKRLTLSKRVQYLKQLQQQLEDLSGKLNEFPQVYAWQHFWLQLPAVQQTLLKNLVDNRNANWGLSFQKWYLQQVLQRNKDIGAPSGTLNLAEYAEYWQQFQKLLPLQVEFIWQNRRLKAEQAYKKAKSLLKGEADSRKTAFEVFTEFFPLLISDQNEINQADWLQLDEPIFDWVIVLQKTGKVEVELKQIGKRLVSFKPEIEKMPVQGFEEQGFFDPAIADLAYWAKIEQGIQPYFGSQKLLRGVSIANLKVPLLLQTTDEKNKKVVFLGDGFLSQSERCDFAWEWKQQELLQKENGCEIIPIWSAACWQNLSGECRKIAAQIITLEKKSRVNDPS